MAEMESGEWRRKQRESHMGQEAWNKDKTKFTDARVKKSSETMKRHVRTPEHCKAISLAKKDKPFHLAGWNKGLTKETSESVKKVSEHKGRAEAIGRAAKKRMADPEYVSRLHKAMCVKPNKVESRLGRLLDKHFPREWAFVGDGQIVLGGKVPDFANMNGGKKLIELFGDYWHKDDKPEERIAHFRTFGFETLVIWERELADSQKVVERIRTFRV